MTRDGESQRQRHFLIWLSETEPICTALQQLAAHGDRRGLAESVCVELRAAHRAAEVKRSPRTAFRFRAPAGTEELLTAAAIKIRRPPA